MHLKLLICNHKNEVSDQLLKRRHVLVADVYRVGIVRFGSHSHFKRFPCFAQQLICLLHNTLCEVPLQ
jgi:hypothetical protein